VHRDVASAAVLWRFHLLTMNAIYILLRACRMVGNVLTERTVSEVKPAVTDNMDKVKVPFFLRHVSRISTAIDKQ
jgi:hypothetical protein